MKTLYIHTQEDRLTGAIYWLRQYFGVSSALKSKHSQLQLSVCVIDYSGMPVQAFAPHRSMMDPEFVLIQAIIWSHYGNKKSIVNLCVDYCREFFPLSLRLFFFLKWGDCFNYFKPQCRANCLYQIFGLV